MYLLHPSFFEKKSVIGVQFKNLNLWNYPKILRTQGVGVDFNFPGHYRITSRREYTSFVYEWVLTVSDFPFSLIAFAWMYDMFEYTDYIESAYIEVRRGATGVESSYRISSVESFLKFWTGGQYFILKHPPPLFVIWLERRAITI